MNSSSCRINYRTNRNMLPTKQFTVLFYSGRCEHAHSAVNGGGPPLPGNRLGTNNWAFCFRLTYPPPGTYSASDHVSCRGESNRVLVLGASRLINYDAAKALYLE